MLPATAPPGTTDEQLVADRRSADDRISRAIDLGWRFATLRAITFDEDVEAIPLDGPLPAVPNLPIPDRLEVDLLAAEGDACRLGVPVDEDKLERLRKLAALVKGQNEASQTFRATLCEAHLSLAKKLWAANEKEGEAYELGIMLFDTWCRIMIAYTTHGQDVSSEWKEVFGRRRVNHLLTLLDDLQSRLDPSAVVVVRDNLQAWRTRVNERVEAGELPTANRPWREVRSQALTWRQLLTGDKEPEAYLAAKERATVRTELIHLMWRRYLPWVIGCVPVITAIVVLVMLNQRGIWTWWSNNPGLATVLTGTLATLAGVLGISKASMTRAARSSLQTWSRLLWNRALARVVCRSTLRVQLLFPDRPTRWERLSSALQGFARYGGPPGPPGKVTGSLPPVLGEVSS
jgi:hypothetical protein